MSQEPAARHPLFSRLSGQVIWCLFEEKGVDTARIDAFMDHYAAWRGQSLAAFGRLLEADSGYLRIEVAGPGRPCPECAALDGRLLPVTHPDLARFCPPYALGCRATAAWVSEEQFRAMARPLMLDTARHAPRFKLHCDSEWIFTHPWQGAEKV